MIQEQQKRLLVVAAHPDDEVLGCGATVAKLQHQGWQATLVLMTQGVGGRAESADALDEHHRAAQQQLAVERDNAARQLGFEQVISFDFPDNRMDTVAKADIAHQVAHVVAQVKPDLVFTHHPGDYNWDHTCTFEAVMMGARCNPPDFSPAEIRTFEVLSSTERAWHQAATTFMPNCWVDVAQTLEHKCQALQCYQSELRNYPHPRSVDGVRNLARKRGNEVGIEYAEAFHVVRRVER
ncbi:PIG-L deacetylase family protein [Magnetococcus sp. PR-3]|uniref:PIG-L deacetylase family protein n=1 Tax=Magnetococcus sp. PR-3 TaxID=3120355 RepID=UPI002FCDF004